jgi:uncharacterized membrane protein
MALPRADRREIFGEVRRAARQDGSGRKARGAHYTQVIDALRVTPFDRAAMQAALDAQKTASLQVQSAVQAAWLDRVAQMSDEARASYAGTIEDILRRGPRRGGDKP